MSDKTKLCSVLLLSLLFTAFLIGYVIEYQNEKRLELIPEITNYSQEIYEPFYDNPWNTNWTRLIIDNNTYIYFTEKCTENQINKFIEENYTYREIDDCFIWRYE